MSKLTRETEKLLKAIEGFEPAPLNNNKGPIEGNGNCPNKVNSKKRRHRGWVTARVAGLGKYSEMFCDAEEPQIFWDDWVDSRDGRRYNPDRTHIRSEFMSGWSRCRDCKPTCRLYDSCRFKDIKDNNQKLFKQIQIRNAKKEMEKEREKIKKIGNEKIIF
jgi:hypothetical protein